MGSHFRNAAKRSFLLAGLLHNRTKQEMPTQEDMQALSACLLQVAALLHMLPSEVTESVLQEEANVTDLLIQEGFLPERYKTTLAHFFRESLESDNPFGVSGDQ